MPKTNLSNAPYIRYIYSLFAKCLYTFIYMHKALQIYPYSCIKCVHLFNVKNIKKIPKVFTQRINDIFVNRRSIRGEHISFFILNILKNCLQILFNFYV